MCPCRLVAQILPTSVDRALSEDRLIVNDDVERPDAGISLAADDPRAMDSRVDRPETLRPDGEFRNSSGAVRGGVC